MSHEFDERDLIDPERAILLNGKGSPNQPREVVIPDATSWLRQVLTAISEGHETVGCDDPRQRCYGVHDVTAKVLYLLPLTAWKKLPMGNLYQLVGEEILAGVTADELVGVMNDFKAREAFFTRNTGMQTTSDGLPEHELLALLLWQDSVDRDREAATPQTLTALDPNDVIRWAQYHQAVVSITGWQRPAQSEVSHTEIVVSVARGTGSVKASTNGEE